MKPWNNRSPDHLTIAYIAHGVRKALTDDQASRELHLTILVTKHAGALHREWQRRYGADGIRPGQAKFGWTTEIAEPFGERFAKLLIAEPAATPDDLITALFNRADPTWTEEDAASTTDTAESEEQASTDIAAAAIAPWRVHANGDAGSYAIYRNDISWYMSIQMNGEIPVPHQEEVLAWITRSSLDRSRVIDLLADFDGRFGDAVAEDLDIDGGDAVEWISEFAPRVRDILDSLNSFGPPQPRPID